MLQCFNVVHRSLDSLRLLLNLEARVKWTGQVAKKPARAEEALIAGGNLYSLDLQRRISRVQVIPSSQEDTGCELF